MALTIDRDTQQFGGYVTPNKVNYGVAQSTIIYKGTIVAVNSSGYLVSASDTAGLTVVGMAAQHVDNSSGNNGDLSCVVDQGVFWWTNTSSLTISSIGKACYVNDNGSVCSYATSVAKILAGTVYAVDSTLGIAVAMGLQEAGGEVAGQATFTGTALSCPVTMSTVANSTSVWTFTPPFSGRIVRLDASTTAASTTTAKTALLTVTVSAIATSATLTITSTANNTLGNQVTGVTATAATFTAGQQITVIPSSVTTFIEGAVDLMLYLAPV